MAEADGTHRGGWRESAAATLAEATGRGHRNDPHLFRTGGPAGNARLTAWLGLGLLVLFLGELVTLVDVHQWISWHIALGALLLPPALAKTATTGWRVLRYYTGNRAYRAAGPPPMPMRILGPLVVGTTLGLLISGVVLIAVGPDRSRTALLTVAGQRLDLVTIHQGFFVLCAGATGLHVLGRLLPAFGLAVRRPAAGDRVDGRAARTVVLAVTAALAAITAVLLLAAAPQWRSGDWGFFGHDRESRPSLQSHDGLAASTASTAKSAGERG